MTELLIIKTGALGDVLRTTSILPGLHAKYPGLRVTWLTAPGAVDLVARHPLVAEVRALDPNDSAAVERLAVELGRRPFARMLSLDDEEPLCRLAAELCRLTAAQAGHDPQAGDGGCQLSGAYLDADGARRYTPDVGAWFDMGLLSVHGKARADALKVANQRSHAAIYADMFGIEMGEPELPLGDADLQTAAALFQRAEGGAVRRWVGLNTGSGGRWESKKLTPELTVELARAISAGVGDDLGFVLLGGPEERERNAQIAARLSASTPRIPFLDAGTDNSLLDFAGIVDRLDLLVTSDSLALHIAVARRVPVLAFFAPTSAAEIELYGRGRKIQSTAGDYCSYAKDADTSTLTVERLAPAALELLGVA